MHRISLPCEIPQGSLVHLCAETCSYVAAKETVKVVARHTLMTRYLLKDRADIAFTEYLHHSRPCFLSQRMVDGKLGSFLGRAVPRNVYIYVIAATDGRWPRTGCPPAVGMIRSGVTDCRGADKLRPSGALPCFESYADHDRITRIVLRHSG
jgi:hypothetical protein